MPVKAQARLTDKPSYEGIVRRCGGNVAKAFIKILSGFAACYTGVPPSLQKADSKHGRSPQATR